MDCSHIFEFLNKNSGARAEEIAEIVGKKKETMIILNKLENIGYVQFYKGSYYPTTNGIVNWDWSDLKI